MGSCCSTDRHAATTGASREAATGATKKMKKKERKKQLMEALAAEAKTNELLARIPGRMCRNGASSSVCTFTQQGRKGTNQDAMVAWEDFAARKDTVFCGVFDGHGPYGHLVARRVRDSLPSKLASIWKARMRGDVTEAAAERDSWANSQQAMLDMVDCDNDEDCADGKASQSFENTEENSNANGAEEGIGKWREAMVEAYEVMDKDLRRHPTIDCFCSGSTAVTLLMQGEELVIGNVGDSRAVLGTRKEDDTLEAVQLTVDLKPNLPREAERILKCKGRVFALEDEPEVPRVWLPYDDAPGLAMARAFGDFCLKDFGLISVPEMTHRKLSHKDEFVVLATDGVWDVLSNKEVVDIVSWAPTRATAARALVETAVRAWRLKYPNSKVDDCAVVCLYLQHPPNYVKSTETNRHVSDAAHDNGVVQQCETGHKEEEDHIAMEDATFGRSNTVRAASKEMCVSSKTNEEGQAVRPGVDRSHSVRSIADCLSTADNDEEWSALEGVVRVNSLLNLPRFLKGDKRGGQK